MTLKGQKTHFWPLSTIDNSDSEHIESMSNRIKLWNYAILYPKSQRSTSVSHHNVKLFWPVFSTIAQEQQLEWCTEAYNCEVVTLNLFILILFLMYLFSHLFYVCVAWRDYNLIHNCVCRWVLSALRCWFVWVLMLHKLFTPVNWIWKHLCSLTSLISSILCGHKRHFMLHNISL